MLRIICLNALPHPTLSPMRGKRTRLSALLIGAVGAVFLVGCAPTNKQKQQSVTVTVPLPRVEYSEPKFE
jgi:hypothetical protein